MRQGEPPPDDRPFPLPGSAAAVGPAMAAALRAIDAAFHESAVTARRKQMARTMLRAAAGLRRREGRYEFWGRYRELAKAVPDVLSLADTIAALETAYVLDRAHLKRSTAQWWANKSLPVRLRHMREARLMLRWLRRHAPAGFTGMLNRLQSPFHQWDASEPFHEAAE